VFDFFGNPRSALITGLSGASLRIGYDYRIRRFAYNQVIPSRADRIHEVEWHLDALTALGVPIVNPFPHLVFFPSRSLVDSFWNETHLTGCRVIGLNFSGGWPAKRWPLGCFADLARYLQRDFDARVVIVWGPGEGADAERLQNLIGDTAVCIPPTDLKQLAEILQKLDLFVSTDSGPMHIAAAVGTPCVGIFGPTRPGQQGPYGESHVVVRKTGLDCLGCNRVDCRDIHCMSALDVETVREGVHRCVEKNRLWKT
ncbi:glycosyltransferase family 9 protein, partial [candidate division KSB1 bacterium]|nr:glycosyltransferase family 9 protein [candidate division KSB1 bacterium]